MSIPQIRKAEKKFFKNKFRYLLCIVKELFNYNSVESLPSRCIENLKSILKERLYQ